MHITFVSQYRWWFSLISLFEQRVYFTVNEKTEKVKYTSYCKTCHVQAAIYVESLIDMQISRVLRFRFLPFFRSIVVKELVIITVTTVVL